MQGYEELSPAFILSLCAIVVFSLLFPPPEKEPIVQQFILSSKL